MIPKTVHFVWLGGKPYPKLVRKCIESWHRHMPEYDFIKWDESNAPLEHPYVRKALKKGYYAFASDYIRIYALHRHGGIYLDADMEVIRPLDELLNNRCFLGYQEPNVPNASIIGSTPSHPMMRRLLEYYDRTDHFEPIPDVLRTLLQNRSTSFCKIYDPDFFYPYNPFCRDTRNLGLMYMDIKPHTFAIHHWQKSWRLSTWDRWKRSLKKRGIL